MIIWELLLIFAALLLSAVISGTEAAFIAVNKIRIRLLSLEGEKNAGAVQKILTMPEEFFAAVLILNNVLNIFIAAYIGSLTARFLGNTQSAILIATAITSGLIILISELTPKSIANAISDKWSLMMARPLLWLIIVARPLIRVFTIAPKGIRRLMRSDANLAEPLLTAHELRSMIDLSEEQGQVESQQGELLDNVFRFSEKEVRDIMTPRPEIKTVDSEATLVNFMGIYTTTPHTRFPVLDRQKDDIIGIVAVKEVMKVIAKRGSDKQDIRGLMQNNPWFVPETQRLNDLFKDMQENGQKMAIAIDEFGAFSGLITLTRLVEQIVGRTKEEGDPPEWRFMQQSDDSFIVNGALTIEEARDDLQLEIPEGDYETLAGFFIFLVQHIPKPRETIDHGNLRMTVLQVKDNRIQRLRIEHLESENSLEQRSDQDPG